MELLRNKESNRSRVSTVLDIDNKSNYVYTSECAGFVGCIIICKNI